MKNEPFVKFNEQERLPVKVLIIPHFEIGEMLSEKTGEAQLLYREYLSDSETFFVNGGVKLFYNKKNKAAIFLSGCGKVNAAINTMAVLSDLRFDFSDSFILCTGCAGGAYGYTVPGDVVLINEICDYDSGHFADIRDEKEISDKILWYPLCDLNTLSHKVLNSDLINKIYKKTENIKLSTTKKTKEVLKNNFSGEEWALREPTVKIGTAVTGDNYYKGVFSHKKAEMIVNHYKCKYPYTVSEMEDIAIVTAAERFGLLDKTVVLRVCVNTDLFLNGETAESLWGKDTKFISAVNDVNRETFDIFPTAINNAFKVAKTFIDDVLTGKF